MSLVVGRYPGGSSAYRQAIANRRSFLDDPLEAFTPIDFDGTRQGIGHIPFTGPGGLDEGLESELSTNLVSLLQATEIEGGELCAVDWAAALAATADAMDVLRKKRASADDPKHAAKLVNWMAWLDDLKATCQFVLCQPNSDEYLAAWW